MWLYLPSSLCPSSPASADSTSESRSPSPPPALWLTLSGKPTQRPISWRGWKIRSWIKLLSGTTLAPSTAARGVESWIASLAASRARTSPPPASRKASGSATAPASGLSSHESLAKWDPASSSWRTSQLSLFLNEGSTPFSGRFPTSGTMRSGSLWQRPTWAPRISESASSSWPTARANDSESCGNHSGPKAHKGDSLTGVTKDWQTPAADSFRTRGGDRKDEPGLTNQAKDWRTPNTRDHHAQGPRADHPQRQTTLVDQTSKWHTPNAAERSGSETQTSLRRDVKDWPTPRTTDSASAEMSPERRKTLPPDSLTGAVKGWPTPVVHDSHRPNDPHSTQHANLQRDAETWPTPRSSRRGPESEETRKARGAGGEDISSAVQNWPTPTCPAPHDSDNSAGEGSQKQMNLAGEAIKWATPNARDFKGEDLPSRHGGASLAHQAQTGQMSHSSPRVPVISTAGVELSPTAPTTAERRRLNPAFVCWLIGWPWWWTRAERISFAAREMESWLSRQRSLLRSLFGG